MSETQTESADADTDDAESETEDSGFDYYPQVTQHPTTVVEGDMVEIVTGADIDSSVESTGSAFGLVYEDPEVKGDGTVWKNSSIPEGFETTSEFNDTLRIAINGTDLDYVRGQEVTDEVVEQARERVADVVDVDDITDADYDYHKVSGTDYKIADPEDTDANIGYNADGDQTGIDVGGGEFESTEVDEFDTDHIMVWYSGMSGQFVGRGLDFNGMLFARYTDPDDADDLPYLVKGLFQAPIGWRGDADVEQFDSVPTTDRSELARAESNGGMGRPPRVVRPPVLRDDIDGRAFIAIGRYNGGNMYEVHIGRAADDYDEILSALRNNDLGDDDYDALDMKYDQSAEETLSAAFDNPSEIFALYHGEGWQDEPEEVQAWAEGSGDDGGSFDTPDVDVDSDAVDHPTEQEVEFANGIVEKLTGTDVTPDDAIFPIDGQEENADLEELVEHNSDQFNVDPDTDSIREHIYANTDHLSVDDL